MSNLGWFTPSEKLGIPDLWTPAMIDTALWLDAADESTITLNGATVSQWKDKSGGNRHLAQSVQSAQPSYISERGRKVLSFPAAGKYFQSVSIPNTTNNASVFILLNAEAVNSYYNVFEWSSNNGPLLWVDASNRFELNTTAGVVVGGYAGSFSLIECATNTASPKTLFRVNGGAAVTSDGLNVAAWSNPTTFSFFNRAGSSTFRGKVAEILWIDGFVSSSLRLKIEGYLAHKWGLAK